MENAADALKLAAAILIFIIAIASSFSLFGTAKQTADSIITMRDKQAYLEEAELDNGILYTSSSAITSGNVSGFTTDGDRVVKIDDVISTIYRYSVEKYGVTIIESDGTVIARFDSSTESIMADYERYKDAIDTYGDKIKENLRNIYVNNIKFTDTDKLQDLYKLENGKYNVFWYGNTQDIMQRISVDLNGGKFEKNGLKYTGKNILNEIKNKEIIEITNEIDNSKYLKQTDENGDKLLDDKGKEINSALLQQYNMPKIEIIYIVR